jgi:hypothetical protein
MTTQTHAELEDDVTFVGACHGCIALAPSQVDDFYRAQAYVSFAGVVAVLVAVCGLM